MDSSRRIGVVALVVSGLAIVGSAAPVGGTPRTATSPSAVRLIDPMTVVNDGALPPRSSQAAAMAPTAESTMDPMELEFVQRINDLRAGLGLRSLTGHSELVAKARSWSATMAARGDISHSVLSDAINVADWYRLGENVGMGPSVSSLHDAFVASPKHYENLVDLGFEYVGIGIVVSNGTIFVTQSFMEMKAPAQVPEPDATAEPTPGGRPRSGSGGASDGKTGSQNATSSPPGSFSPGGHTADGSTSAGRRDPVAVRGAGVASTSDQGLAARADPLPQPDKRGRVASSSLKHVATKIALPVWLAVTATLIWARRFRRRMVRVR